MKDNMGWKCQSQVPPSTGKVDQSESLQMRRINKGIFPQIEEIITHYNTIERFESECMALGIQLLSAITGKLEVAPDFFIKSFQSTTNNYNSTLRMLNYFPVEQHMASPQLWRAGAHTDFGFLTLLFQRAGQTGLQVCGGRDYLSEEWIPVEADDQSIVCNIGDMLKRLSGDKLVSNFHRVVIPDGEASMQGRNSIAFFCQPNKDVIISDPSGNYQQITAGDYFTSRMAANYSDQKMYMKK
ncbi:isopenicillin N synthase family oxygenase [Acidithiobacillus ferrooxidans]|uniref:2OG-Fe(II) oxygenase family protein n=1 Tax=Acidithiobacillus ferrooxidans TaxID=920 RepID=UPI001C077A0A|nr:2OG-Fe(II) oxygenase family protein [Acidithiobacillus ferrooxidans]MBU2774844.1 isopenicillin N synthase family oxygenase [Acidithiobacillus ferrooxidans]